MSTFRNPVGPQPSSVYWRRRLVVGLLLLAVIVIVVLIVIQPRGDNAKEPKPGDTTSQSQPPADPDAACVPGTVEVTAATDKSSYAAGENPRLSLTVTNIGAVPCTINAGTSQQEFLITSGSELYWNSKDCQTDAADAAVVLQPGVPVSSSTPVVWDRTRSSTTTCDADRAKVPAGGASYHLNINLGDLKSNDVQFILN
jgi:hypothetical protein